MESAPLFFASLQNPLTSILRPSPGTWQLAQDRHTGVRQRIGLLVRRKLFVLSTSRGQRAGTWPAGQLSNRYSIRAMNPRRKGNRLFYLYVCAGGRIGNPSVRSQTYENI